MDLQFCVNSRGEGGGGGGGGGAPSSVILRVLTLEL